MANAFDRFDTETQARSQMGNPFDAFDEVANKPQPDNYGPSERSNAGRSFPSPEKQTTPGLQPPEQYDSFVEATGKSLSNVPERFQQSFGGLVQMLGEDMGQERKRHMQQSAGRLGITPQEYKLLAWAGNEGLVDPETPVPDALESLKAQMLTDLTPEQQAQVADMGLINPDAIAIKGQELRSDAQSTMKPVNAEPGSASYYTSAAIGSIAEMTPALFASAITRNPAVGMSIIAGQVGGESYGSARDEGLSVDESQGYAFAQAAAEAIPEYLPISRILKPGTNFFKKMFDTAVAESLQEGITASLQAAIDKDTIRPDMTWGEARGLIADSMIIGGIAGPGMAAITEPLVRWRNQQPGQGENPEGAPPVLTDTPSEPAPEAEVSATGLDATPSEPNPFDVFDTQPTPSAAEAASETGAGDGQPVGRNLQASEPTASESQEAPAAEAAPEVPTESGTGVFRVPVDQIKVDPEQYQFRSRVNAQGVDQRLDGVKEWDDRRAGSVLLHRRENGDLYVADGHHRVDLARKLNQGEINAQIIDEADGVDVAEARVEAAMNNIADGKAEALDVAKVFRDSDVPTQEVRDTFNLPNNQVVRDGESLSKLTDNVFGMVTANQLSEKDGAAIGSAFTEQAQQEAAADAFQKVQPDTEYQRQLLINEVRAAGFAESQGEQEGLFGDDPQEVSLMQDRLKVLDTLRQRLNSDKRLFKSLNDNADRAGEAGNQIATEANESITQQSARTLDLIGRVTTTPALNEMVNRAARRVYDGESRSKVVTELKQELMNYEAGTDAASSRPTGAPQSREPAAEEGQEQGSGERVPEQDATGDDQGGQPESGQQDEVTPALDLETQTEEQLAEQAQQRQQADQEESARRREEEQRAQADEQVDDFTLAGSERQVDQAEARGQSNLFDAAETTNEQTGQADNLPTRDRDSAQADTRADTEADGEAARSEPTQEQEVSPDTSIAWSKDGNRKIWRSSDGQIITDESFGVGGSRIRFFPVYANDAERNAGNNYASGESLAEAKSKVRAQEVRYSFAGQQAETADTYALDTAKQRLEEGADPEAIRQETGWFKGKDGKWRFEIDDSDARYLPFVNKTAGKLWTESLGDVLDHPKLFAAYPGLRELDVVSVRGMGGMNGNYNTETGEIMIDADRGAMEQFSTLLHEIQHGLQTIEGFARGGNSDSVAYMVRQNLMNQASERGDFRLINRHQEALRTYGLYSRAKTIVDFRNITQPRQLFNSSYWYEYSDQIRNVFDAPPKRGPALRQYAEDAGHWIANRLEREGGYDIQRVLMNYNLGRSQSIGKDQDGRRKLNNAYRRAERKFFKIDREQLQEAYATQEQIEKLQFVPQSQAYDLYRRLYGEVESRNVQARQGMTEQERRETPPESTQDVANDEAIVIMSGSRMNNAPQPANAQQGSERADYRRNSGAQPQTLNAEQARTIASGLMRDWKGRPPVTVADSISEFPKGLREAIRQAGAESDMRAVFWNDEVYILAPRIPNRQALEEVILHEVVGHYGLRKMVGGELKPLLDRVYRDMKDTPKAKEIISIYFGNQFDPRKSEHRLTVAEELLAHLAESGKQRHRTLWQRIVAAVRDGLRRLGFTLKITDTDLLNILAGAQRAVELGGFSQPSEADMHFSRAGRTGSDRTAWPADFPRVQFAAPLGSADKHPRYQAAKSGDVEAARELVADTVDDAAIERVREMIGDNKPVVVATFAEEATGRNMIPVAYAARIAKDLGLPMDQEIIQSISVKRTGEGSDYRLANHAVFEGEVAPDQDYLIIDDTLTMGGTLASLRGHIEANGGNVIGAATLTGFGKEGQLALGEKMRQDLWRKHGAPLDEYLKEEFGYGIDSLTQGEAGHLRKAENLERIRERIDAARAEVGGDSTDGVTPPPRFSRPGIPDLDPQPFGPPSDTLLRKMISKIADKFTALKGVQQNIQDLYGEIPESANAYLAEELFHGKVENDIRLIEENMVEPLAKAMSDNDVSLKQLDEFLYALHAPERNRVIAERNPEIPEGGSGMTDAEAAGIIAKVEKAGKLKQYQALSKRVHDMLAMRRKILRGAGLLDEDTVGAWEASYKNYVPLKGWAADEQQADMPRIGKGFAIAGKESQMAAGRKSRAASPLANTISDLSEAVLRRRKNEVGNAFMNLVEAYPNGRYWQVYTDENPEIQRKAVKVKDPETGRTKVEVREQTVPMAMMSDRYFTTKRDGKTYYIRIEDERLMNAMRNIGPDNSNLLVRSLAAVTRVMSSLNTSYNPEFVISNFSRDIQTALLNLTSEQSSDDGKARGKKIVTKVLKDTGTAIRAINASLKGKPLKGRAGQWQKHFDEFRKDGAKTGWFDMKDIDGQMKDLERMISLAGGSPISARGLRRGFKAITEWVENTNSAIENGVRLSAYVNAIEAGIPRSEAASLAKNMTVNFNRKGELGTMMNALYMFANASVQGTANFVRTLGRLNGVKGDPIWQRMHTAQKIAAGMAVGGFMLSLLNRLVAGEDEDEVNWWDKVPDYVKERNIVIMKSLAGGEPGEYWTIPLPYGYNIFPVIGTSMEHMAFSDKPAGDIAGNVVLAALGSFSPIGFEQSEEAYGLIAKNIMPTILRPVASISLNENFMGGPIFKENFPFGTPKPDSALYFRSTPEAFKALAEGLNDATGGSEFRSGAIDLSPDVMQFLVGYYGGGAYNFLTSRSPNFLQKMATGVELEDREIPFLRKVSGKVLPYEDQSKFYDRRNEINQLVDERKALKGRERIQFMKDYGDKLRLQPIMKSTEDRLKKLREQRDQIELMDLSAAEEDQRLQQIEKQMKRAIDQFNKRYSEADD